MRKITILLYLISVLFPSALFAEDPTITEAELVRRTQAMLDALVPGDQSLWKLYMADDVMVFDEKGNSQDKKSLLADIKPMPTGYTGMLTIRNAKTRFAPNVAILSYDADEVETVFGQQLHARYHTTDTWLYRNHVWQIVADQTLCYYEDPAVGVISETILNDYTGVYELAPSVRMIVTRQGKDLFAQRGSGEPYKLLPESTDLFFRPGAEGRRLFHRLPSGQIDVLIDRRNSDDLIWKKLP